YDIFISDAQTAGIKFKFRLFSSSDADSDLEFSFDGILQQVEFFVIVDNRNRPVVTVIDQTCDVLDVLIAFESVADDVRILSDFPVFDQFLDDVDVERRGCLDVDVVLERFVQYIFKVRTLRAIAVEVTPFVFVFFHRLAEPVLGPLDAFGNLWQICEFQWSSVLLDKFHQIDVVKQQRIFIKSKLFLREIVGLVDQVYIFSIHLQIEIKG